MTKKIIFTEAAPAAIGPYSQAVQAGQTLYVSGQIALAVFEAGGSIEEETLQVMKNLQAILSAAGATFEDVVKCSIFIENMDDFAIINQVYGQFFPNNPPARETVQVARLPKNVRVEISCIAHLS
ncbi:RidA family protein [Sandaracinomonas limnophila]|jgi:2-iminobutanoate/2-iminopropanoate deaminase|uniref:RidA family protein n=1 Tax=Sandaracinomonas limnophila TaxID=1862386 RepID=A0A437PRF4_9BACT|nr:Rid family detoxifying hydrolase [Sandaracinomonas limnophila]RVU24832.1 RidA family protein [Sandaracinomonas limnophila]